MKKKILLAIAVLLVISVIPIVHVMAEEEGVDPCGCGGSYAWSIASSHHYGNGNGYCNVKHDYVEWYKCSRCSYVINTRIRTIIGGCGAKL
ncbi:MAG: hypothetical protein FWG30_07370 [Eubacteriaceae bacterium]|nr:hypothetical protein [Eubacteriaceae bacterium]